MENYIVIVDDNGTTHWLVDCKLHRENGPAVEYANGNKEWWRNGKKITEEKVDDNSLTSKEDPEIKELLYEIRGLLYEIRALI